MRVKPKHNKNRKKWPDHPDDGSFEMFSKEEAEDLFKYGYTVEMFTEDEEQCKLLGISKKECIDRYTEYIDETIAEIVNSVPELRGNYK